MNEIINDGFSWIPFYMKFADVLLSYRNDRQKLIEKCQESGIVFPQGSCDPTEGVDPFTVFAALNAKGVDRNVKKRIELCASLARKFNMIDVALPTGFDGVPILPDLNKQFVGKGDKRLSEDIGNLWDFFKTALELVDENGGIKVDAQGQNCFAELFDRVQDQCQVKWNVTCGLFWMRPRTFVGLDDNNRAAIKREFGDLEIPDLERRKKGELGNGPVCQMESVP